VTFRRRFSAAVASLSLTFLFVAVVIPLGCTTVAVVVYVTGLLGVHTLWGGSDARR